MSYTAVVFFAIALKRSGLRTVMIREGARYEFYVTEGNNEERGTHFCFHVINLN